MMMSKKDKERRVYPKGCKAEGRNTGTEAPAAGKPGSIGWRESRKVLVPVDTAGPGNGRDGLAPFPGGGTGPLAEGRHGAKDYYERNNKDKTI
jgi:hypothetical protein